MSRKDTIIIAALLNAGLLIVLFTTALKTDSKAASIVSASVSPSLEKNLEIPARKEPQAQPAGDEVDQVLRDYSSPKKEFPAPSQAFSPLVSSSTPSPRSFADEINAITLPSQEVASNPPPISQNPPSKEPISIEVTVKKGDVLEKIARTHHTTVDQIMKQNHLTSTNLKIGQVLKITPHQAPLKESSSSVSTPSNDPEVKYYTVKSGDNPWTIAVKNHMKVEELLKLNNLDADKARRLKPGDQLRIK